LSYWNGTTYALIQSPLGVYPQGVYQYTGPEAESYLYSVVFNGSTMPTIGGLSGTVIALATPIPPTIACPDGILVNEDGNTCGASVAFAAPTVTGYPAPTVTCQLEDGTAISSPYEFPVGETTVYCSAVNSAGSQDCSFTVTVAENNPPVAGAFAISPKEGTAESIPEAKIIAKAQSPTGAPLNIVSVTSPTAKGGAVTLGGGLLTYTPAVNYVGTDAIDYELSDGCGMAPGTISVTVVSDNAPSLNGLTIQMSGQNAILQFHGIPGQAYYIQVASALTGPWTDLPNTPVTANGLGLINYTVNFPPSPSYYRTSTKP
jgi:hypothetical protein